MTSVQINASAFNRAIDQVVAAASKEDELTMITNVLIEAREGSLRLVGTDRYRLAVRDLMCQGGPAEPFRVLVEPAALRSLQAHLADAETVLLSVLDGVLRVAYGTGQQDLTVTGTDFPPYERLLTSAQEAQTLTALRADMVGSLSRYGDDESLQLTFTADALIVNSDDPVPATYTGVPLTITLRRSFLSAAIENSVGTDVMIEATAPDAPVCVRSADDGSYLCMIMPIREPAGATT